MAVGVENSSQLNSELVASAGNYHMGSCNVTNCSATVCGNATSQPNAIVNVKTNGFVNNSPMNELTLPNFIESSNQIVLNILRDHDEYYRINNFPEQEIVDGYITKAYARIRKKTKTEGNV